MLRTNTHKPYGQRAVERRGPKGPSVVDQFTNRVEDVVVVVAGYLTGRLVRSRRPGELIRQRIENVVESGEGSKSGLSIARRPARRRRRRCFSYLYYRRITVARRSPRRRRRSSRRQTNTNTTLSGGSLGSYVDEERSQLREVM